MNAIAAQFFTASHRANLAYEMHKIVLNCTVLHRNYTGLEGNGSVRIIAQSSHIVTKIFFLRFGYRSETMLVTAHKGFKMLKAFLARMFPSHQWVEVDGRRTCSVCERVEELNEVLGVSWDTIAKGDPSKHAITSTDSIHQPSPVESVPHPQV